MKKMLLKGFEKFRKTASGNTRFVKLKEMHSMLPVGSENAESREYIAALWNVSTRRAREIMTEEMNRAGLPVCNLRGGYFIPRNSIEMKAYYTFHHSYYKSAAQNDYYLLKLLDAMILKEVQGGAVQEADIAS